MARSRCPPKVDPTRWRPCYKVAPLVAFVANEGRELAGDPGLIGVGKSLGMGRGAGCRGLSLGAVDPGEDDEIARVEARVLGRDEDADVLQAGPFRPPGHRDGVA